MLGIVVAAATCRSELAPLPRGALNLQVRQEQIAANGSNWRTSWGSFSKELGNKRVLVVNMKVQGQFNPRVLMHWYFVGRDLSTKKLTIYSSGERSAVVSAGGAELVIASSEIRLKSERENVPPREGSISLGNYGSVAVQYDGKTMPTKKSGAVPYGWTLIVTQDGRIVGEAASLPDLIKWTKDCLAAKSSKDAKDSTKPR
jgi:hypothetical protein